MNNAAITNNSKNESVLHRHYSMGSQHGLHVSLGVHSLIW